MHPNAIIHIQKFDASVIWLARWGVADSRSLCRSASYLVGHGKPSVQARHWAQLLVRQGFAECVELSEPRGGVRKVFIATRTARLHAMALGESLSAPYIFNESRLEHRLIAQRVVLDLIGYVRIHLGRLVSYTSESEMAARSAAEFMERWPDARLVIETATAMRRTIYVEVERNVRSAVRLNAMGAGLAELLHHRGAMNVADRVLVLCPSPASAKRYQAVLEPGSSYLLHERRGLGYVACGGRGRMPKGILVIAGWSVPQWIAEELTGARASAEDVRAAAAEL